MVSASLTVVQPGLQSTIQDWPGRVGFWRVGIPPSGPMDELAFRLANRLLGNPEGTPGLEFQFLGPKLRADCDIDVAVVGGGATTVDGVALPSGSAVTVRAGEVIDCGGVRDGARGYLAVAGGFGKAPVLGSAATFPRGGVGGKAIAVGDALALAAPSSGRAPRRLANGAIPALAAPTVIEVTAGPHFDWFDDAGAEALAGAVWTVSSQSDRTGIRLSGPPVSFADRAREKAPENGPDPTNVINTGYAIGGVNLCGDTPIILPVDGPSQGGFITPLVVASAAMWKVGQLRPNRPLVFRRISLADAIALRRALERRIADPALVVTEPAP